MAWLKTKSTCKRKGNLHFTAANISSIQWLESFFFDTKDKLLLHTKLLVKFSKKYVPITVFENDTVKCLLLCNFNLSTFQAYIVQLLLLF